MSTDFVQDARFTVFWNSIIDNFDMSDETKPIFYNALRSAGYYNQPQPHISTNTTTVSDGQTTPQPMKEKKKLSGYNLFMREKSAELKKNGADTADRMKQVAGFWKQLNAVEREQYNERAGNESQSVASTPSSARTPKPSKTTAPKKEKGSRPMTGYQYYVRCMMPEVSKDTTVSGKDRIKKIAEMWGGLEQSDKENYKVQATTQRPKNEAKPETENEPEATAESENEIETVEE